MPPRRRRRRPAAPRSASTFGAHLPEKSGFACANARPATATAITITSNAIFFILPPLNG